MCRRRTSEEDTVQMNVQSGCACHLRRDSDPGLLEDGSDRRIHVREVRTCNATAGKCGQSESRWNGDNHERDATAPRDRTRGRGEEELKRREAQHVKKEQEFLADSKVLDERFTKQEELNRRAAEHVKTQQEFVLRREMDFAQQEEKMNRREANLMKKEQEFEARREQVSTANSSETARIDQKLTFPLEGELNRREAELVKQEQEFKARREQASKANSSKAAKMDQKLTFPLNKPAGVDDDADMCAMGGVGES
ncbi:hypothetical protein CBR_g3260 [Chara braunii]|uniref:Trichohyalin-plectin-homology domain-containing protein n=1 Tax=Chara braunii TaxID=69332 RepID=A0A388KF88_CHABU|nr:hypothetical protein CBR_g3260 [Chara braunii]|eukprot:GBG68718.1 hypothetical protein CBR_g3260 [Chara braunii]